jgi:hypothetical protein
MDAGDSSLIVLNSLPFRVGLVSGGRANIPPGPGDVNSACNVSLLREFNNMRDP